jgi:hypothetical protein
MSTALQSPAPPKPGKLIVHDEGPAAYLFDTARFEHMQRISMVMARASLIPDHLRGQNRDPKHAFEQTAANCLLVVNQAVRWGMDPFAVAPETYVVRGKLGFQGKLVAAVVNSRAGLQGRLSYSFEGQGDGRTVTVTGKFEDEDKPRTVTLSVGQAKTDNTMWTKDPDQKLVYSGTTKWARRHCPEIMLGVLTDDDLERMVINAQSEPVTTLAQLTDKMAQTTDPPSSHTPPSGPTTSGSEAPEPSFNPPTAQEQADAEGSQVDPAVDKAEGVDEPDPTPEQELGRLEARLDVVTTITACDELQEAAFAILPPALAEGFAEKVAARKVVIRSKRGAGNNKSTS